MAETTLVENQVEVVEEVVREELKPLAQNITQTLRHNYDKVFEDGTLLSLHISIWGMSAQLTEHDLNIEKQPTLFKLGKKMLMKPEVYQTFERISSKARGFLYKSSFRFPIAEAHFVSNKKLNEVNLALLELKQEFDTAKQLFFDNYQTYKNEVLAEFPDLKEKLEPYYPPLAKVREKFSFDWVEFRIAMPKEFGLYDLNAKIAEDKVVTEAETKAQQELMLKAKKQAQMLSEFVNDAGKLVRSKVLEQCQSIANKIQKKEIISKANINSLLKQVTDFNSLNFLDDKAVEGRLEELKALLTDGKEDFKESDNSIEKLETTLNSIIEETMKITDVDALTGKYFRTIHLDD